MAYPDADIYQIDERGLTRTAYEDTEGGLNFKVQHIFRTKR